MAARVGLCLIALALAGGRAAAQPHPNLDFENGLLGWTAAGDAFEGQPSDPSADPDRFPASPLGGDYWKGGPYPIGHGGRALVASGRLERGTLTSDEFLVPQDAVYFSVLVGGPLAPDTQRLELHIADDHGVPTLAWMATSAGTELLQQRVFRVPSHFAGRPARIVIIDAASNARISVDHLRFTRDVPRPGTGAVWGFADYHTHPMSSLAFGALRGVHGVWGRPGGAITDYARSAARIDLDLPPCTSDHGGGHTAGIFINTVEKRILAQHIRPRGFRATLWALLKLVAGVFTRHADDGAPRFDDHPSFLSGAHQQMHVTQIHRAWQGGLRLIVALAVHNRGAEYLLSPPRADAPTSDREALEAQVCGLRRLAALNSDWMDIAYSPGGARDIIRSGRLAVVLGAELDELGDLEGVGSIDEEVGYLWKLGVRQVTPIHAVDNRLGGAAIFEPAYNSLNDFLRRGSLDVTPDEAAVSPPAFFEVVDGGCTAVPPAARRGECVLFKLAERQDRAVMARTVFSPFSRTPTLQEVRVPRYREHAGHLNARGLTGDGRSYLAALLDRGMLVGTEHMSQRTLDEALAVMATRDYPVFVSHAHFRALGIQERRRTTAEGFLPDELDVADSTLEAIRSSGGAAGVFTYQNPLDDHEALSAPFDNDCSASSKTFAYALLYALARMGSTGPGRVALATDFTFVPATAPRFGENACWGLKDHWDARPGAGPLKNQYRPDLQTRAVRYAGRSPHPRAADHEPLEPYKMGRRTFDFNVDGLAHYGMLPDLLQDLRNIGLGTREFGALFSSADGFITMWERAERAGSPRSDSSFAPQPLACDRICRGLCP